MHLQVRAVCGPCHADLDVEVGWGGVESCGENEHIVDADADEHKGQHRHDRVKLKAEEGGEAIGNPNRHADGDTAGDREEDAALHGVALGEDDDSVDHDDKE